MTMTQEKAYFDSPKAKLFLGDSFSLLPKIADHSVDVIFADPPYFLSNGGVSCHSGRRVSVNKGEWDKGMTPEEKLEWNQGWLKECRRVLKGNHYFNYSLMKEENGGKQMKDVWILPLPSKAEKEFGHHPTQKPLSLLTRILEASTKPGDLVLDPFCGSGTTGVACLRLGREFIGLDNSEDYLEMAKRRLEKEITK